MLTHLMDGERTKIFGRKKNEEEYIRVLEESIFCICPSGSGPNSIRLWEAVEFGCIPVIISDDYDDSLIENIIHIKIPEKKIRKVAICSGSGSFLINNAIEENADIYITSDLKYHDYFLATDYIALIDIGHYQSEIYTKSLLFQIISSNFNDVEVLECQTSTNPVVYD